MSFFGFHPIIEQWFRSRFASPTEPQEQGWPRIAAGEHTLIAAPTGSGKTLTAFLACIDRLLKRSLAGELRDDAVSVVYVSPLRALSNDMHRNLEVPLADILELAAHASGSPPWEGGAGGGDVRNVAAANANGHPTLEALANAEPRSNAQGLEHHPPRPPLPKGGSKKAAIRVGLRTGDTTASERAKLTRKPPHILVTTPESLFLMLTAPRARETLKHVETVIVDEIHALVRDKRGSHLALSLERLEALVERPIQRIGLSATQKPIERIARFLVGERHREPASDSQRVDGAQCAGELRANGAAHSGVLPSAPCVDCALPTPLTSLAGSHSPQPSTFNPQPSTLPPCAIVNVGHTRTLDLAIETPPSELGAVCMHEQWAEVDARLVELINSHRSTLVFVNTRRLAERLTHELTELLGEDAVSSHHGSLSAEMRLKTERRLKSGELKAVVATASLELGIDIGYIDLVIQIGSPRSIATFLQRIGRSGHSLGLIPKGRMFALTRDELLECMALMRAVRAGRLDTIVIPEAPLDVLAQQIVAEAAAREWHVDELFDTFCRANPYRNLSRHEYDETIKYLSEGVPAAAGRIPSYLHHDHVNRKIKGRPGARIAAISNAGAIPETGNYRVVAEPDMTVVGTLDEDFAVESNRGDIFLLGNTSWRLLHVRGSDVTVADAHGAPPTIPFWRGEAPGRTLELSEEVSKLREEMEQRLDDPTALEAWLIDETKCDASAAAQMVTYVASQQAALGLLPTAKHVIFERFFDETGGMQIVVHSPFGAAINRAWAFAMRKRFCVSFDFELQATADDDGFILSVGPQHSFPLEGLFATVNRDNVRYSLEQSVLRIPVYQIRWRWNASRALLVLRRRNGQKIPPALQRFRADDVLSAIFPRLTGCQEHTVGPIELPDHPLARQTMEDCLHEYMDLTRLRDVLEKIETGEITLLARDTREPSPFCYELLNANPYAFLDGGEIQEQRTRAVATRRSLTVESLRDLAKLDPEAIAQVRREAQPLVRNADELHDVLLSRIVLPVDSIFCGTAGEWSAHYEELERTNRAATISLPNGRAAWVSAERLPAALAAFPSVVPAPAITAPPTVRQEWEAPEARTAMVRGLVEICGPTTPARVADELSITASQAESCLVALEGEGSALRGIFEGAEQPATDSPRPRLGGGEGPGVRERALDTALDSCSSDGSQKNEEPGSRLEAVRTPPSPQPSPPAAGGEGAACSHSHAGHEHAGHGHDDHDHNPIQLPARAGMEWCHRRLLARIHRLTMDGLRKQIEPVAVETYLRFLTRLHGLVGENRRTGPNGLFEAVSMLQGIDIPAAAWESDILSPRLTDYKAAWLDELCFSGEVSWGRLFPPKPTGRGRSAAGVTRVVPMSLFLRGDVPWLSSRAGELSTEVSGPATDLLDLLRARGALFSADLLHESRMLPSHLRDALGELVFRGLVTADGFSGLRQLLGDRLDADGGYSRQRNMGVVRKRVTPTGAGRWSLWRRPVGWAKAASGAGPPSNAEMEGDLASNERNGGPAAEAALAHPTATRPNSETSDVEHWAWQLLRRWGVVFRDLLTRESGAPSWFELLQIYRRLEARGEIRGGRFIAGVAGEQFAVGDTVRVLRQLRDEKPAHELVVLSAADPLNLVGIVTPHARIPSTASNRIALLDGVPVAALQGNELVVLRAVSGPWQNVVSRCLSGACGEVPVAASDVEPASDGGGSGERPSVRRGQAKPKRYPNDIPRPIIG